VSDGIESFLGEWHRVVSEKDVPALERLLAEDVSLGAPPYWPRLEGRELVHHLLGLILDTIGSFTYHREWRNGSELALEFTGRVADLELQGIDLISLNDGFQVQRLDVLMRPTNSVNALQQSIAPRMTAFLARRGATDGS
jgi:hypothetical protein